MLTLDRVRKAFGSLVAVDDLSLTVERSEIFGLLGPNGAGKTTTLSMAVGLLAPDQGSVTLDGDDPTVPSVRARIGVAPQSLAVYDELTAFENLAFLARLYGISSRDARARADELLELFGLADRARSRVATYSGGMKRRLNIACALVHSPPMLLLDEPTVGVDPQSRNAIFDSVRRLRDEGVTIVYTTHYMEEAERLCNRVGVIDKGRLLALGTIDELLAAHGGPSAVTVQRRDGEVRHETTDPVADAARLLNAGDVMNLRIDRPNLEGVFLNLTGRSLRD